MSVTPYLIKYKNNLYKFFRAPTSSFKLPIKEIAGYEDKNEKEILMIGLHRIGGAIIEELLGKKDKLLVVDHNPDIINTLTNKKISCIYGDISSPELLDKINMNKIKMVISTIPDYEDNLRLLKKVNKVNPKIKVIVTGSRISEAIKLYENGANFVITPKIIAGQQIAGIVHSKNMDLKKAKQKHLKHLNGIHKLLY